MSNPDRAIKTGKENRRHQRIRLDAPLKVVMGSMGSTVRYDLMTKDISSTGFFLAFDKPGRFPFTPSSIMEVWMEMEEGKTIFFNGKMARIVNPGDPAAADMGPGIAIRIVQIDKENTTLLEDFLTKKIKEKGEAA